MSRAVDAHLRYRKCDLCLSLLSKMNVGGRGRMPEWCPGAESNHRHCDFQSHALPTELPGHAAPSKEPQGIGEPAGYSGAGRLCPYAEGAPKQQEMAPIHRSLRYPLPNLTRGASAPLSPFKFRATSTYLFPLLLVVLPAGDDVRARQPTMKVEVPAARRAERARLHRRRPAADRTPRGTDLTFASHLPRFLTQRRSNPKLNEQLYLLVALSPPGPFSLRRH
jgi:hypothetical protein